MVRPTSNPGLQRRIRDALYQLKLDYGVLVDVYKLVSSDTDYDTGLKTEVVTKNSVRRCVMMPAETARASYISPYFTQTNKPFITKGAGWDEVTDVFLFDGRDLRNYDFAIQDWIVHDHVRYEVKSFEEIGQGAGWAVLTTLAKGSPANEILEESAVNTIVLDQTIGIDRTYSRVSAMALDQTAMALVNRIKVLSNAMTLSSEATASADFGRTVESPMSLVGTPVDEFVPGLFSSTWQTANTSAGSSTSSQIALPLESGGTYNFVVDWGDGSDDTITVWNQAETTHTYSSPGEYTVTISGTCSGFRFNNGGDKLKILNISSWGTLNLGTSVGGHFFGCTNLTLTTPDDTLDMTGTNRLDASFANCTSLTNMPLIDTSAVEGMNLAWSGCSGLTSFPAIDVSGITISNGLQQTWNACSGLTSFPTLTLPAAATVYTQTWKNCSSLTSFPALNFSAGVTFNETWRGCSSLTSFPATAFTAAVTVTSTWHSCTSMTSFGACTFPLGENFTTAWYDCNSLTTFPGIDFPSATVFNGTWRFIGTFTVESGLDVSAGTNFTNAWGSSSPTFTDTNFGLQFANMTIGTTMFNWSDTTALRTQYTQFLIDLESVTAQTGVTLGVGTVKYNAGAATARSNLVADSWTITDGGAA